MQVEALHDMPVAVPSLMEKFPLDLGIIVHVVQISGGGEGGGEYCHTYMLHTYSHIFYLFGYIGMCRCEGYGFQAVYSGIGYINQSVWV